MKKYAAEHILYTLIQWTWGIVQNSLGLLIWILLSIVNPKRRRGYYHGAILTHWAFPFSMGLGMFIFYGHGDKEESYAKSVLVHEYGHTLQSCLLGPLFMPVIAIPSCVWAFTPAFVRGRKAGRWTYFDLYAESWANKWGEKVLHMPAPSRTSEG